MESNSDKQLRDKLTGVEFPFDPQAWDKMETMLDEKKKRRGFFWLWTGGIAAVLLVALIGYELGVNSSSKQVAANSEEKSKANTAEEKSITNDELQITGGKANTLSQVTTDEVNGKENQHSEGNNIAAENNSNKEKTKGRNEKLAAKNQKSDRKQSANNQSDKSAVKETLQSNEESTTFTHKTSSKQKRKQQLLAKTNEGGVNTTVAAFEKNPFQEETEILASAATQKFLAERIEMDRRTALLASSEDESSFNKKKEESLPKEKKNKFTYSLGVLANVSATIVGDRHIAQDSLACPACYDKPTYAVGITHDFLFGKRVAVTNSILFSQTGFKICNPKQPRDSSGYTTSYTSTINELQIPIGIKVYPVVKERFRFYIAASIINHIKLTETFEVERVDYYNPNFLFDPNTLVTTADNPFMGGLNKSTSVQNASYTQGEQAEYFGMGGLKRYYASFYASAGVEYIHKKKYVFFTEPMFYMSLNKIGLQEKRKYNVGVSGGFRYQF